MCKQPPPLGKCLVDSQREYVVYSEVQFKYMNILKSRYSKLTSCKSSLWFHLTEKKKLAVIPRGQVQTHCNNNQFTHSLEFSYLHLKAKMKKNLFIFNLTLSRQCLKLEINKLSGYGISIFPQIFTALG